MKERQAKSPRLRLFVALDLPEPVRQGIAAWAESALADPALRPVPARSLHITLTFLGQRSEAEVERIAAAMRKSAMSAPSIELLDPVARPLPGQARLFALPARSAGAEALQARLRDRLVAERLHEPEKRPFWPHVTVARVRSEGRGSARPRTVASPPRTLPADLSKAFSGVRMTLYRSELQPSGAHYVPLAQVKLPSGQQ